MLRIVAATYCTQMYLYKRASLLIGPNIKALWCNPQPICFDVRAEVVSHNVGSSWCAVLALYGVLYFLSHLLMLWSAVNAAGPIRPRGKCTRASHIRTLMFVMYSTCTIILYKFKLTVQYFALLKCHIQTHSNANFCLQTNCKCSEASDVNCEYLYSYK